MNRLTLPRGTASNEAVHLVLRPESRTLAAFAACIQLHDVVCLDASPSNKRWAGLAVNQLGRAILLVLAVATAGCFGSETPLGRASDGRINSQLLGKWLCVDPEDSSNKATLLVSQFDDRQYFAEWREDEDVSRYRAYSTEIRGTTLLNTQGSTSGVDASRGSSSSPASRKGRSWFCTWSMKMRCQRRTPRRP
jgi:hypothetical protein